MAKLTFSRMEKKVIVPNDLMFPREVFILIPNQGGKKHT